MTTPKPWLTPSIVPTDPPPDPPLPGEDRTMRTMRKYGFTGPITRQDYLDFIHATDDPQEPSGELESMLPLHLQDFAQFERKPTTGGPGEQNPARIKIGKIHN